MRKVIDVSSYNNTVNWKKAKSQGVSGAILKIIRKDLTRDNQFNTNYKGCESIGLPWGVYNYSYATTVSKAKSDMKLVCDILDKINKNHFSLGVWFDLEDETQEKLSQAQIASMLNAAKEVVEGRGYPFGVYTGLAFYKQHINRELIECKNWWIARYYKGYDTMNISANPNESYKPLSGIVAWQYTSSGRFSSPICSGNDGNVDLNIMYKDMVKKKGDDNVLVKIGSARINEKGRVTGGKAGDQTGGEVGTQNWYLHSKGWVVIRPKDKNSAEKIAQCMEWACANDNIGYCQTHRDDLRKIAVKYKYSVDKVKVKVEVDCSALVRVCCLYAGISVGDFNTASEISALKKTGKFEIITDKSVCESSDKLKRGDILVTKTKGHTVVVLTNGAKVLNNSVTNTNCNNSPSVKLIVDGVMGADTTKRAQQVFGTPVDGKISNQLSDYKTICKGILTAEWSDKKKGGSALVKAIQKWVGATPDGYIGSDTIKKLQRKLGTPIDGRLDNPSQCIKSFQKWLNNK